MVSPNNFLSVPRFEECVKRSDTGFFLSLVGMPVVDDGETSYDDGNGCVGYCEDGFPNGDGEFDDGVMDHDDGGFDDGVYGNFDDCGSGLGDGCVYDGENDLG